MIENESERRRIIEWRENPCKFVYEVYGATPDKWQEKGLMEFAKPGRGRISFQACAGPGKSCALAWMIGNFVACYGEVGEHPKGAAVSITKENLADNLWTEVAKWHGRSKYMQKRFDWQSDSYYSIEHPRTWYVSTRTWSKSASAEEQGRTLSGLHSKFVLAIVDESGDIPIQVLRAGEQALTNCAWGKIVQAGNPTSVDGMLYAAFALQPDKWVIIRITGDPDDPNRSQRVDIDHAREMIKEYGRDNPWVQSYILGEFPRTGVNSLLSPEEVHAAMNRQLPKEAYQFAQKRLGIDVALYGDDMTVLFPRQGLASWMPECMRTQDPADISARAIVMSQEGFGQDREFVDCTGGYGSGVVSYLKSSGRNPFEVQYAARAMREKEFYNKRAENWWLMAQWVKNGGSLAKCYELVPELTMTTYTQKGGRILVEPKEMLKKKLGRSPDRADALSNTFALPDTIAGDRMSPLGRRQRGKIVMDWNPIGDDRF